jgi:hypothetical protein
MTAHTWNRLGLTRFAVVLAACLLLAGVARANDATVEITADVDVVIFLDGAEVARIAADESTELRVNDAEHEVWIIAAEAPGVGEGHVFSLLPNKTEEIDVELAREVEDWLEDDEDDRAPAPWDSSLHSGADGTLVDPEHGLAWARADNGRNIDWASATNFCSALELAGGGWRLPTMDELETLVSRDLRFGYRVVEPIWLTACCTWSSEEHGSVSAWYMGFDAGSRGFVTRDYDDDARALCVRGQGGE